MDLREDIQVRIKKVSKKKAPIKRIAERSGLHRNSIAAILSGKWPNMDVLLIASQVLKEIENECQSKLLAAQANLEDNTQQSAA